MDNKMDLLDKLCPAFPFLKDAPEEVRKELLDHAALARIPKGEFIFFEEDECKHLALMLSGNVRVYKPAESGREITLYRLGKGDSCILTASCIFSQNNFPAVAVTEEDSEAVVIPSSVFREWINSYEIWRDFVFKLLSRSLSEVIATVEEVAFRRMDMRIAEFLVNSSRTGSDGIKITHQDIASELGTSREVVSRILKHFEYEKLISMGRGTIVIRDIDALLKKTE
jgi:CRP/FNR family transcriptional regulator